MSELEFRWQVVKAGVLSQTADDDDAQVEHRLEKRHRRISTVGYQPDFRLDSECADTRDEPSQQLHAKLMFGVKFPVLLVC